MKKYKIKLVAYHAFGSEETFVEANDEKGALKLARELYPRAEDYVILDILPFSQEATEKELKKMRESLEVANKIKAGWIPDYTESGNIAGYHREL